MRLAPAAAAFGLAFLSAPAGAQGPNISPAPYATTLHVPAAHTTATPQRVAVPSARATPVMTLTNPPHKGPASVNGTNCTRNGVAAQQQTINPITGQPQAATIVSIPVTKGGGSIPSATTRQQQLEACAHRR